MNVKESHPFKINKRLSYFHRCHNDDKRESLRLIRIDIKGAIHYTPRKKGILSSLHFILSSMKKQALTTKITRTCLIPILALAVLTSVPSVYATTFYVSPDGDDSANGLTEETAFRTITHGVETARAGDTVLILPGIYMESVIIWGRDNSIPITLRGAREEKPVLEGMREMIVGLGCLDSRNLVFENLEARNYTDFGIAAITSSDIVIRNLMVHHNGFDAQLVGWEIEGYGIDADECSRVLIENNTVHNNGPDPQMPGRMLGTGINTYRVTDGVIRGNDCNNNIGGGILVEDGVNVLVENNSMTFNYLDASAEGWWDGALWLDGGHDVTVRNNFFAYNFGPGIQISDEDFQNPYGYLFEDNIVTENLVGVFIWNLGTFPPPEYILRGSGNEVYNNTWQDFVIIPWF